MSDYPYLIRFIIFLNILLFITFIILSFVILIMRLRRDEAKKKLIEIDKMYYDMVLELIFAEDFDEQISTQVILEPIKKSFLEKPEKSEIYKNAFLNVISKLYNSLTGDSRKRLTSIYMLLELDKHSRKKLSNREWDVKVQGIKEIAMMKVSAYSNDIAIFINDPNRIIRREARVAFLQLNPKNLETFINKTTTNISYWEIINIINVINTNIPEYLANFKPKFDADLGSLVYFCLKITNYYLLAEYADSIAYLVVHRNADVRILAIQTCALFGNKKLKGLLKEKYATETDALQVEIIRAFKIFGHYDDIPFLSTIISDSTTNNLKFEALKSINDIIKSDKSVLLKFKDKDPELSKMVRHILDKRILQDT